MQIFERVRSRAQEDFQPSFQAPRYPYLQLGLWKSFRSSRCLSYRCFHWVWLASTLIECPLIFLFEALMTFCRFFPKVLKNNSSVCHAYLQITKLSKSFSQWTEKGLCVILRTKAMLARRPCTGSRSYRPTIGTTPQTKRRKWLKKWTASDRSNKNGSRCKINNNKRVSKNSSRSAWSNRTWMRSRAS